MTGFRKIVLLASAVGVAATAMPASARFVSHPRRAEVNGRLFNQQHRINQGVKDGQLTTQEAHTLRKDDRGIYHEERQMAQLDGGHITRADQRSLNQQETAVSKQIHTDRHN
ncbi:MAG: hypothetical protein J0I47_00725 [Sphingomonas sp.]|uniref:hypothetical protein n=1 Tax=Sphingomonas sp. TaxID=28214 RepID=UPI001AC528AE|nr:hypothetical protein [Sphingomonas sp.]MBN8806753.1 hypothetical protein [Sphingomonas sp.]